MNKHDFESMEVKPKNSGWYQVKLYQYKKENPEHPDYIREWMEYRNGTWDYGLYKGCCCVCFIYKKENRRLLK